MNWLKYSGVFATLTLNPYHWRLGAEWGKDDLCGPKSWTLKVNILFLGVHIVIDDGQW